MIKWVLCSASFWKIPPTSRLHFPIPIEKCSKPLTNITFRCIIKKPNQLNTFSKGYFCLNGIVVSSASFYEFDKMQIPPENDAISSCCFSWFGDYRSLRFCALAAVGALFICHTVIFYEGERKWQIWYSMFLAMKAHKTQKAGRLLFLVAAVGLKFVYTR